MPAVVTDQFRITNAGNFVNSVLDPSNSFYVFLGLPNPQPAAGAVGFGRTSNWDTNTPDPIDNLQYLTHYRDTSLFGKKINASNIRRVVKKHSWVANTRYDMYRHDYRTEDNKAPNSQTGSLYRTNFYVITSEFKVYICLDNGGSGLPTSNDAKGNGSKDEPTFTDLEPAAAGTSNDGYIWKYLFTVPPSDVIKFDSIEYIVLPNDWSISTDSQIQAVREAGNSDVNKNQIKTVYIEKGGSGYNGGQSGQKSVSILGDGTGAEALITYTSGVITDVVVTRGGSGYTYAMVDLGEGAVDVANRAKLIPIIPPSKGHGFDIYTELGADKVLVYSRFDDSTRDFPSDTHFAQVGILKNPNGSGNTGILTTSQFSSVSAIKLSSPIAKPGNGYDALIGLGITQGVTVNGVAGIATGIISSYDDETLVLKYIQDRSLHLNPTTDDTTDYSGVSKNAQSLEFSGSGAIIGGNFEIPPNINFSGITTTINNKQINLGVNFQNGLAKSEINKKTGDIIYIDNRKEVTRNIRQKEDVKIILEF